MALITGRRAGGSSVSRIALSLCFLAAGGLCLAVAFLSAPLLGAVAGGALAAALLGGVATTLALRRAGRLARQVEKMSGEIDLLSRRLVTLEQREAPAAPTTDLESGLSEVTAEIGLLGGIVRELAMAVAVQDEDLTRLKAGPAAAVQPAAPAFVQPPQAPFPQAPAPLAPAQAAPPVYAAAPAPRQAARSETQAYAAPSAGFAPAPPTAQPAAPSWLAELAATPVAPAPISAASVPADPILPREAAPAPRRAFVPEPAAETHSEAEILAALAQGLEVHLQPVVSLPQRKVAFYEALARLRVGETLLSPAEFLRVLERHGRTTELDRLMLARVTAIGQHLASRGSETPVAYALSPGSLFEPGFLRAVGRLIDLHPELAGRMILALPQRSWRSLDAEQASALRSLRERIGLAVDRVADPRLDAAALASLGASYAKVGLDTLLGEHGAALAVSLARSGIRLVAEGVERETDVPDLIDLDLPLAQGAVFSPPRVVRPEVLSPPAPEPAPEPQPPADDPPPPVRRAFRDTLRRAV
ncbi:cyclic-di-GMP phosphodiesterase, flagellum assembly factor TipF [Methylobacterium sp. 174MFSha1.1]|uniref:EAL domain-containing protein n=1 Tax=Methylobacterium sp. 174MFSha1.1 TaxID=1502749 RepID=UPI0008E5E42E|nr:EAL domain-containing protein [Methylobacterium sp. 174MFSha1.1]SFV04539.1 cyclic-di-GMP phosphodiesterase, flagellum assembly factor TipF [Methylobacterium sp. 174MFSha1.1]